MKGLDTNVLVRFLVRDDKEQAGKASVYIQKVIASGEQCLINHIVLCELSWVLESAYGYRKQEIADVMEKILITKQFEVELRDTVRQAISEYTHGTGDLADYLIGRINHLNGCNVTATFDRALRNSKSFLVID
jgi:predicted nucleic-acid-binding protein